MTAVSLTLADLKPKRASKYGNESMYVDGIRFDSKKEGRRYGDLKLLERAGQIRNLERQPKFPFVIGDVYVCEYRADFAYFENNERVIEDVKSKGTKTPIFKLKMRLMEACYPGVVVRLT